MVWLVATCASASCASESSAARDEPTTAAPDERANASHDVTGEAQQATPDDTTNEPAAASDDDVPFDFADPAMRPQLPMEVCSVPTSGVPSAIRVKVCNCGERVGCRVSGTHVDVLEDPRTMRGCTDCLLTTARCAIMDALTPGHATLRINEHADVRVDTDDIGLLVADRCWRVPGG